MGEFEKSNLQPEAVGRNRQPSILASIRQATLASSRRELAPPRAGADGFERANALRPCGSGRRERRVPQTRRGAFNLQSLSWREASGGYQWTAL
jgi:hypothetical protein